ncbi:hypothetical protein M422DRAFT_271025 [Sphaerobolus stellatus SS14]|uniref:Uncharacterized protein n=1 Tax=Sphaerobolus stellatus (strain SS14) TaxID=990650 RepID=A0A0C9U141_SPHS4|nr:hypothetical protein M422DRAFT_271025 [Sphaerobolus stellatus SS14]
MSLETMMGSFGSPLLCIDHHMLLSIICMRINLVIDIPKPESAYIEGDTEELTEEEYNIVFVGGLEKKKKKKKVTKEKDLPQQQSNRGGEGSLHLESPLSSAPSSVRGSPGGRGGPKGSGRSKRQSGVSAGGRGELDDDRGDRDDMDLDDGETAGQHSNKCASENRSLEPEEMNANAKCQKTDGIDDAPGSKEETMKVLTQEHEKLVNTKQLTDPIGVVKMLRAYQGQNRNKEAWKRKKEVQTPISDAAKKLLMCEFRSISRVFFGVDMESGEGREHGEDEQEVQLGEMKVELNKLIEKGGEIVSEVQKKGNSNGGRDGVGSSMMDVTPHLSTNLSKWGVPASVVDDRSRVVKFVQDLSGEVLKDLKDLSDNLHTGQNIDLKLYFEVLKYLEAVMKNHVQEFKPPNTPYIIA